MYRSTGNKHIKHSSIHKIERNQIHLCALWECHFDECITKPRKDIFAVQEDEREINNICPKYAEITEKGMMQIVVF
jgi:hypothetical protein